MTNSNHQATASFVPCDRVDAGTATIMDFVLGAGQKGPLSRDLSTFKPGGRERIDRLLLEIKTQKAERYPGC